MFRANNSIQINTPLAGYIDKVFIENLFLNITIKWHLLKHQDTYIKSYPCANLFIFKCSSVGFGEYS